MLSKMELQCDAFDVVLNPQVQDWVTTWRDKLEKLCGETLAGDEFIRQYVRYAYTIYEGESAMHDGRRTMSIQVNPLPWWRRVLLAWRLLVHDPARFLPL